jgi:hypothetical protein
VRLAVFEALGEAVEFVDDDLQVRIHDASRVLPPGEVGMVRYGELQGNSRWMGWTANSGQSTAWGRWTASSVQNSAWSN